MNEILNDFFTKSYLFGGCANHIKRLPGTQNVFVYLAKTIHSRKYPGTRLLQVGIKVRHELRHEGA